MPKLISNNQPYAQIKHRATVKAYNRAYYRANVERWRSKRLRRTRESAVAVPAAIPAIRPVPRPEVALAHEQEEFVVESDCGSEHANSSGRQSNQNS